jgi:ureidoacrylate peracid hydrolase
VRFWLPVRNQSAVELPGISRCQHSHLSDLHVCRTAVTTFRDKRPDVLLRSKGIKTLVLGGFLTNCCVESTMRSGYENGYQVITLSDCVAATTVEEHENALTYDYPMFSKPMTAEEFVKELTSERS